MLVLVASTLVVLGVALYQYFVFRHLQRTIQDALWAQVETVSDLDAYIDQMAQEYVETGRIRHQEDLRWATGGVEWRKIIVSSVAVGVASWCLCAGIAWLFMPEETQYVPARNLQDVPDTAKQTEIKTDADHVRIYNNLIYNNNAPAIQVPRFPQCPEGSHMTGIHSDGTSLGCASVHGGNNSVQ